jgi:hypothetical protein
MGKRGRKRGQEGMPHAAETPYSAPDGGVLTLRGAMTVATRQEYAALAGTAAASGEDVWQRRVEFLFERLAVRWELAGAEPLVRQKELLGRYRFASPDERHWIRDVLRTHLAEWFPDLDAP